LPSSIGWVISDGVPTDCPELRWETKITERTASKQLNTRIGLIRIRLPMTTFCAADGRFASVLDAAAAAAVSPLRIYKCKILVSVACNLNAR
jgi:hypothetical protein